MEKCKLYDIPFRTRTLESDFSCKDGEIDSEDIQLNSGQQVQPGHLPPAPEIEFAIVRDVIHGWHTNPDNYPTKSLVASDPSMEYWTKLAAQFLSQFQTEAAGQNLFVSPFYAMGVWRSTSGKYLAYSTPQKLIPNSSVPLVSVDDNISATELDFHAVGAVCGLRLKMKAPEVLRDWVGKIASLDIMVSQPLQKYDSFSAFLPSKRVTSDSFSRCLDLSTGQISDQKICTQILPLAWKANVNDISSGYDSLKFTPFASIPLSEVDMAYDWCSASDIGGIVYGMAGKGVGYQEILHERLPASSTIVIEGKGEMVEVMTRPIKLSGAGEFKMVVKAFLRGRFNPDNLTFAIFGSRDMQTWWCIGKRSGGTVVQLPHSYFRLYKVSVKGLLAVGENLQGFSLSLQP